MNVLIQPGTARGTVAAPPSKSMAHRLLICAALSEGESTVYGVDRSEDILDVARFGDNTLDITSVRISGKSSGIFTTVGMYSDRFVNTAV